MPAKSLLLSMVARTSKNEGDQAFVDRYPGAWIVWEPGSWRPAVPAGTLLLTKQELEQQTSAASDPGREGLAFYLDAKEKRIALGREPSCQIVINDGTLSHQHLLFTHEKDGRWNVRDTGSKNGTWIDGEALEASSFASLNSGARIKAGSVILGYYSVADLQKRAKQLMSKP